MSEDYKKIAPEDVKKGQWIRVVERYPSITAMYEGVVVRTNIEWNEIELGAEGDETTIYLGSSEDTDILLLEDVPEPKVVRTETVTVTHYDDGTKTETPVKEEVKVPMVIETMDQFEEYEEYLKQAVLKDAEGYYWKHRNGEWLYGDYTELFGMMWDPSTSRGEISDSLPMTVVGKIVE